MKDPVLITEVLSRSEQGTTLPFLCRGEDGQLYYVKGRYAGLRSLCCEWVAGWLAGQLGLRTPEMAMVEVPGQLIAGSARRDIGDLGEGLAFGSQRVDGAQEISWEALQGIPLDVQARILFFDWWVENEDRTLSVRGGNPNLLMTIGQTGEEAWWDGAGAVNLEVWTFDFNLAFDPTVKAQRFWSSHVFAAARIGWTPDFMAQITHEVERILEGFPVLWSSLPEEWLYIDGDENLPMQLDLDVVMKTLRRPLDVPAVFWKSHER